MKGPFLGLWNFQAPPSTCKNERDEHSSCCDDADSRRKGTYVQCGTSSRQQKRAERKRVAPNKQHDTGGGGKVKLLRSQEEEEEEEEEEGKDKMATCVVRPG